MMFLRQRARAALLAIYRRPPVLFGRMCPAVLTAVPPAKLDSDRVFSTVNAQTRLAAIANAAVGRLDVPGSESRGLATSVLRFGGTAPPP